MAPGAVDLTEQVDRPERRGRGPQPPQFSQQPQVQVPRFHVESALVGCHQSRDGL